MDENKKRSAKSNIYCSVPQCSSYYSENRSFHIFPADQRLCAEWKRILKIGKPVSKYMRVCSEHFKNEDYFFNKEHNSKKFRLKKNVVPSLKLPVGSHDKCPNVDLAYKRSRRLEGRKAMAEATSLSNKMNEDPIVDDRVIDLMEVEGTEENAVTQSNIESIPKAVEDKAIQVNVSTDFGSFDVSNIINSNFNLKVFTGVANMDLLCALVDGVKKFDKSNTKCSIRNKILLTLMRIKLDVTFRTLAILFNVSRQSAQTYFHSTIQLLSLILKSVIRFPDKDEIRHNIPICFSNFKNTRIVLDCTEISIQASKCLNCRIRTYSYYKGKHTCKFLIGVAPSGLITYVSDAYGGRTSDKAIFNCENLIAKLEPLDAIMVDKGFLIEQECAENLITLIRPPFLKKNQQLSKKEAERTAEIARARVHVERSIQRIKNFRVFKNTIPWSLLPEVENIFIVAVGLTNLDSPILARDKFL